MRQGSIEPIHPNRCLPFLILPKAADFWQSRLMRKATLFLMMGAAGSVISLPRSAAAQEVEFNPLGREVPIEALSKMIRIQVEWIELTQEKFAELTAEPDPVNPPVHRSANDGPLRRDLTELIKKGEAKLLNSATVMARSGQRAKAESVQEFIYATEYDPPMMVVENEPNTEERPRLPNATAFETRNVGVTLEVDPVMGADDVTLDLNLSPEIVYLGGYTTWGNYETKDGKVQIKMPAFFTIKTTTQVTTISGQYSMIGAQSPMNAATGTVDADRKVMVFLKADIVVVGMPPAAKPVAKAAPTPAAKGKAAK